MPLPGNRTFNEMVEHIKRKQDVDDESARKIVGSIEHKIKKGKMRLKLMQLQAGVNLPNSFSSRNERLNKIVLNKGNSGRILSGDKIPLEKDVPFGERGQSMNEHIEEEYQDKEYINKGIKIRPRKPTDKDFQRIIKAKKNDHIISWYDTPLVKFASMKLVEENGKYAKYWLLNAKEINGNGWGVTPSSIERNIYGFKGRPFVVTSKKWIPDSAYGEVFDHPHIPTNDINSILKHQEHYRVGNIIDVHERDGEWFAIIERDPKYAHLRLPPFCSPALYQLDALEHESNLSKWLPLHLAGLDENPAYGARIALLRGTCDGPPGQCIHQLKEAKQHDKELLSLNRALDKPGAEERVKELDRFYDIPKNKRSPMEKEEADATTKYVSENIKIRPKIIRAKLQLLRMAFQEPTTTYENSFKKKKIKQLFPERRKVAIRQTYPKLSDVNINPEHGRTIADAYDQMKHEPNNPEVKSAYGALISETSKQYEDLIKGGLKIDKVTDESNAYKNSAEMHRDVLEKNHLNYFPTEGGFGQDNKNKDHPMLQPTKFKDPEGKTMLANDVFRIVHDINGHVRGEPSGFGPRGEHQAYLTHKQMFSPLANKALFTETAGQNNWVNFNKKSGEKNRKDPRNTEYAEQKAGLLPPNIIYGKWHK